MNRTKKEIMNEELMKELMKGWINKQRVNE